ncbi:MAG: hypothetical protein HYS25_07425 [Ignavibacteriales bacterium]|nr:hypothetical protein [Ignavibacteriales bacterium]
MNTLCFSIIINADKQKVWDTMLADKTYRAWTKPFDEGSCYKGSWEKGSEIRFLTSDDESNAKGMLSKIKENIKHQFISIEHIGFIYNGVIDTTSEEVKKWTPAFENYSFSESGGKTELTIDVHVPDEYKSMFEETWPKALSALKNLCEQ